MGNGGRRFDWIVCGWLVDDEQRADWQGRRACHCGNWSDIRVSKMSFCSVHGVINYDTCVSFCVGFAHRKQDDKAAVYSCAVCRICDVYDGGGVVWRIMGKRENGYFTVEAALIFPMVLLFTVMMIFLAFYSYDRCVLEQSAYEAALRGTGNHIKNAQEAYEQAYEAAGRLVEEKLFAMHDFEYEVSVSAEFVTVRYQCVVNMPLMGWLCEYVSGIDLALDVSSDARRCRQTRTIRGCRVVNHLINEINKENKEPAAKPKIAEG